METRAAEHGGLRRLAWAIVWVIGGLLIVASIARVLRPPFGPIAGLILLAGAILVVVRLVRARADEHFPGWPRALREILGVRILLLVGLLVLVGSAFWGPSRHIVMIGSVGNAVQDPSGSRGLLTLGVLLLACGFGLFITDPRLAGSSTLEAASPEEEAATQGRTRGRALERKPREHSHLGALTMGALLITVAILGLIGSFGIAHIDLRILPALVLTVLGAGLLIGAWVGRARWLVVLCVLALPFVALANIIDVPFAGGVGNVYYQPRTATELRTAYDLGVGAMTLNLAALETKDPVATVQATVTTGRLTVDVPQGMHVLIDASVRAGGIETATIASTGVARTFRNGFDISVSTTLGSGSTGLIHLILHCGVGSIQVFTVGTAPAKPVPPTHHHHKSTPGIGKQ